jgi:hypothetical protein
MFIAYHHAVVVNLAGEAERIARLPWLDALHLDPALEHSWPFVTRRIVRREFDGAEQELSGCNQRLRMTVESTAAQILRDAFDCIAGSVPEKHNRPVHGCSNTLSSFGMDLLISRRRFA